MKNIQDLLNNNSVETYNKEAEQVLARVAGPKVTKVTEGLAANDNHLPQRNLEHTYATMVN